MLRLGLKLSLRSGREAMVRLLITAAAVAVGVALLLGVLAEFHAFQANASQPCWSCTQGAAVPRTLPSHGDLWNNSADFYQGADHPPAGRRRARPERSGATGHPAAAAGGRLLRLP